MGPQAENVDVQAIAAGAAKNLYWQTLGMHVVDAKRGWVKARLPVRDGLLNTVGAPVHGGAISSLIDGASGAAVRSLRDPSVLGKEVTLDLNVSYLNAAFSGELFAEARVVKESSTVVFVSADVFDGRGRHIATGRCTYLRLGDRKREPPAGV